MNFEGAIGCISAVSTFSRTGLGHQLDNTIRALLATVKMLPTALKTRIDATKQSLLRRGLSTKRPPNGDIAADGIRELGYIALGNAGSSMASKCPKPVED